MNYATRRRSSCRRPGSPTPPGHWRSTWTRAGW